MKFNENTSDILFIIGTFAAAIMPIIAMIVA